MCSSSGTGSGSWATLAQWRGLDGVEFATLTYVDWFNHRRLHGEIEPGPGFTTPAAFEVAHYSQTISAEPAKTQTTEPL